MGGHQMTSDAVRVGRRVRYWRERRGLDRQRFADMVGRSTSWLDKIEKGERALLRLPMLEQVAAALSIDPTVLTDEDAAEIAEQRTDAVEVEAIKDALGRYPMLSPASPREVSSKRVGQQLAYAGQAWLASHFTVVARVLPGLIGDAQTLVATASEDTERLEAQRSLVMAYRLACSMLLKYESTDIAWLAADRAIHTAHASGDHIALARATRSVARAMSHTRQLEASRTAAIDMADLLRPCLSGGDGDTVPLFGMLLLSAEISAAMQDQPALSRELHEDALAATIRLGPAHANHHTIFGPANVHLHRVAALIREHEPAAALAHAATIDPATIDVLPAERRACYLLDLTEAHTQRGEPRKAITVLNAADQFAAEEVRSRPVAQRLITTLLGTKIGGSNPDLRRLAGHAGVTA